MSRRSSSQTSTTTSEPPSFLQPYLNSAATAATNTFNQGNYVAPVERSGADYANRVLQGGYLGSNPYLDQAFNRASGAVTNQVQSNFGLAGRNARGVDAAALAQEGYNDLATKIYGGDYEAERQRQQALVPYTGQLGATTSPTRSLDDYIARLSQLGGGYGVTSSQIPTSGNPLAGAIAGGQLGSNFGPWGMLGGGILGGLFGG